VPRKRVTKGTLIARDGEVPLTTHEHAALHRSAASVRELLDVLKSHAMSLSSR